MVGPPGNWAYLRIVKRQAQRLAGTVKERYTAYTSQDGHRWVRGGTWLHRLGDGAHIGLVSMGAAAPPAKVFNSKFAYVRVWTVAPLD